MIAPATRDYAGFLVEVKARIRRGQYQALRAVNAELVRLYWDIGEAIHRKQESLGWGRSVVETLARDLQAEVVALKIEIRQQMQSSPLPSASRS